MRRVQPPYPQLVREIVKGYGYGWIDHRFLRKDAIKRLTPLAIALYCILVCAADCNGVSFYSDTLLCCLFGVNHEELIEARQCLIDNKLIVWSKPYYQLLDISGFIAVN